MDSGRFDEGERVVEDEFTCAGMLRGSLTSLHSTVERIFRVHFAIGTEQSSNSNDGQIWLKLRGLKSDVQAAKLFVKGVVNQEEQQEVPYPATLYCVFCGARGLFLDCLIRTTSALIVVGSPGCLLISGLMEPVVRAYSLIADLVERCESTLAKRTEPGERCPGESLESRRAFKNLVEQWDDRHTLDLLVLPGSVKEILLGLLKEARLGDDPGQLLTDGAKQEDAWEKSALSFEESESKKRWDASLAKDASSNFLDSFGEPESVRPEGAEGHSKTPQELSEEEQLETSDGDGADGEEQRMQLSGSKEFWLLLKFFTAMGYTEDVVQRVLAKTGIQEASQILDLVQQEQDRTDRALRAKEANQNGGAAKGIERNRPCETEHKEEGGKRQPTLAERRDVIGNGKVNGATGGVGELKDDDFVFGVLKKAAASCGYNEKQVTEAYSMLPDSSMHDLLLELQRIDSKPGGYLKEGPREMDDVVVEKEPPKAAKERFSNGRNVATEHRDAYDKKAAVPKRNGVDEALIWGDQREQMHQGLNGQKQQNSPVDLRGPPMSSYNTNTPQIFMHNPVQFANNATNQPNDYTLMRPQAPHARKHGFEQTNGNDWSPTRTKERKGAVVVTGEQRFLEGLHSRFELRLTDRPGNARLRNIIIDGSNVAMSHGLGHFFSCRGIALAVQHFWDRGHRQISALVPQWRSKSDSRIKEQHYLNELKELGLVSFTPSREVQGKRISSYDDRLMLQLAQKTDGVIVTNDNLRDLLDESVAWRDIIKKRLLQYTFVGDLFMVPDDPLGRGGPHLDEFLSTEQRPPDSGGHISAPFNSSKFTNYRDRSPGALWEPPRTGGRRGRDWTRPGPEPGPQPGLRPERSPEETARLREKLCQVFPGKDNVVTLLLQSHPSETDINTLSALLLEEN